MPNKTDLLIHTANFFKMHWGQSNPPPEWDFSWQWKGSVPNFMLGGVYALFKGDDLIYVGLGSSRGSGRYMDRGISRRLMAHVYRNAPEGSEVSYVPRERWDKDHAGIDLVATLGFHIELNYLAPALEDYLIGRIELPENSMKRNISQGAS